MNLLQAAAEIAWFLEDQGIPYSSSWAWRSSTGVNPA